MSLASPRQLPALVAAAALLAGAAGGCGQGTGGGTTGSASPSSTSPTATPTLACGAPSADQLLDQYVGLTEAEAAARAADDGFTVRVVGRDGECFAVTDDYRRDRVNLYLTDGVVGWAARF